VNPRRPIYIVSKGRWESRLTARALDRIGVDYLIAVEPQEADRYRQVIDPAKVIELPFSNLGQGSIPARNYVWRHSLERGADWHWCLDDNIQGFYRLYKNLKTPVGDGTIFWVIEDFANRYSNLGQTGMNYFMFAPRKELVPPLYLNTRVYSCILIRNDLPFRWRGRYNEDTDLSLRILKSGLCTVLFNAFLARKSPTMTMKGGNTDNLYKQEKGFDGRLEMALSLQKQHPDCIKVVRRWGRWQHLVDYSRFRDNHLKLNPGTRVKKDQDNYGMVLETLEQS
jgi:hypothetical protein